MGKITEIFPNNLDDKEVGYLIGFFIGDGYSYIHNRHYVVEFYFNSINDKQIINYIKYLLEKIGLNPFKVKDKRFNSLRIKVNSKKFWFLVKRKIVKLNQIKNKNYLIGFISGFIDSERLK